MFCINKLQAISRLIRARAAPHDGALFASPRTKRRPVRGGVRVFWISKNSSQRPCSYTTPKSHVNPAPSKANIPQIVPDEPGGWFVVRSSFGWLYVSRG